ncbi:MAG: hypothetical protein ACXWJ1_15890 [Caldimonas sp.]
MPPPLPASSMRRTGGQILVDQSGIHGIEAIEFFSVVRTAYTSGG